jgi:muramoyltetrapeptide carboxypeptidase
LSPVPLPVYYPPFREQCPMFHRLSTQATCGIVSPAYSPRAERLQRGIEYLQHRGFKIKQGQYLCKPHGYFAGTDEERLADLQAMYRDREVDLILCTRGGWGGLRLVDQLNYDLIRENPKPLIGYSDITTLQLAIWARAAVPSFSGPMLAVEMGKGITSFSEKHFWDQLFNTRAEYDFDFSTTKTVIFRSGRAAGRLLGGCLALVTSLLGTIYCPDYHGAILFLEDTGEKPYRIDRYLAHLQQAGVFEQINGLILGKFLDCNPDQDEISFTLLEIFEQYFAKVNFPVLLDFPYGHGDHIFTMPLGVMTKLDTSSTKLSLANPFEFSVSTT